MNAIFVTGTDTGVGKTTVAAALLASARRCGLRTLAIKPVESGCTRDASGQLIPNDGKLLRGAAGGSQPLAEVCPIALEAPLAPVHAARREGRTIDLAVLIAAVRRLERQAPDLLIIEGAGGLLVPLTDSETVADLAVALGHPLLVVARAGLGTINHTSLTIECALRRSLRVAGVVLVSSNDDTPVQDIAENIAAIESASGTPVLGHLPRLEGLDDHGYATAGLQHLPRVLALLADGRH